MIDPGQHIKCILRNSTVVEGIVIEWGAILQLQSLDGESLLIVHHPEEDIVLTKVVLTSDDVEQEESEKIESPDFQQQFQRAVAQENEIDLRTKSLVELRQLQAKQTKKIIARKLKDHSLGQVQKVTYGQPGFLKGTST
jgi:hypothetical protein